MKMRFIPIIAVVAVAWQASLPAAGGQEVSAAEAKLREALKSVTLQVRTAESEKAIAVAEKAAADARIVELDAQVENMGKQLSALSEEKATALDNAARTQSGLHAQLAAQDEKLEAYRDALDKWKAAHAEISDIARAKESERARYAKENADLERGIADLRTKNIELYKTGTTILERYRKYSLGEAISAREPFTGIHRVKLQNLVQDYHDELLEQTHKP